MDTKATKNTKIKLVVFFVLIVIFVSIVLGVGPSCAATVTGPATIITAE
jgi:hypothetical protein